nr:restriction endonuclease [Nocardia cyriacigeorgica]
MQYIKTFAQAEQNAARQMRALGYTDARVTPPGPDGGIDVLSSTAVAQVKWRGAQVSRPDLHRLYGARGGRHHLDMLFFAATNYSGPAIQYANEVDIALFVYFPTGELDPVNRSAQRLVTKARNRTHPGGRTRSRASANHAHAPAVTTATSTAKRSDAWMLRAQERLAEVAQRLDAQIKTRETGQSPSQRVDLSKKAPQRPDPWTSHAKTRLNQVAQRLESKAASRTTEPQHSNSPAKQRRKDYREQIQTLNRISASSPNRHPRPVTVDASFPPPPPGTSGAPKRALSGWTRELAIAGSLGLGLLAVGFLVIAVTAMNSEEAARTWITVLSLLVAVVSGGGSFALIVRLRE